MKTQEIKLMIIENYIDWYTSDEIERFEMKANALTYIKEDHVDEIAQSQTNKESIKWSLEDFLYRALDMEEPHLTDPNVEYCDISMKDASNYLQKYDPVKFQEALELMINKHDATIGITWDTIDFYLDEYCLKEKLNEK